MRSDAANKMAAGGQGPVRDYTYIGTENVMSSELFSHAVVSRTPVLKYLV